MLSQLLVAGYLVLFAAATPLTVSQSPVTVPLARRFNATGPKTIMESDQARTKFLKQGAMQKITNAAVSDTIPVADPTTHTGVQYTVLTQVGSDPTTYALILDIGSANTWLGADFPYAVTSSSHDTGVEMFVQYATGSFFGEEFLDQLFFASFMTIPQQAIGVASSSEGFEGVDGVLGLGPAGLTAGTTSNGALVPTVLDNAFSLGLIESKELGIFLEPVTSVLPAIGVLSCGGVDPSATLFNGDILFVPITTTSPANQFVGIDQSVAYGSTTILSETAGIVDTGTTLLLLASDAFAAYQQLTGAVLDPTTGLLSLTPAQFANLQSLFFNIGGTTYEFIPNAQIWPRFLNAEIGGAADGIYLIIGNIGSPSGEGLDFVNGVVWLERFYFLWDAGNNQAGFATTQFTDATTN
ncbi:uncharacterized protein PHACADRAFT_248745 [Phanerochaete carnosa HHB-10118-sp]|uniref:Peptidase A1 domain-containing protein n=1 Tax=Phanerochaete carnosa (strain HHB-10118-sp) TaxID=650164 RepID=K5WQX6_PHACS|nr:uncharacterized protein PHACADRAFT_248745 [Phanerochaete carnosa HHB-10118-sp]EKM61855.1 hypothetical protein PHACADRAFT_248745 [Phanerochaete carnosa HHB-10118-sp]